MTRYVDQGSTEQPSAASMEIPEAAVEAAAQAIWEHDGPTEFAWPPSEEVCDDAEANRKLARSALEAALPYLVPAEPQPAGGGEAAIVALMRAFEEAGERDRRALDGLGWVGIPPVPGDVLRQHCTHVVDIVMGSLAAVPQPVDREALAKALHEYDKYDEWDDEGCNDTGTEQRRFTSCKQSYLERADVVLALLAGGES